LTVYGPAAPVATMNDPESDPPTTVHSGFETNPPGYVMIEHPVSAALKPVPEIRTFVPACPEVGNRFIEPVLVNPTEATTAAAPPVIFTV